jgi:hypothetical protein
MEFSDVFGIGLGDLTGKRDGATTGTGSYPSFMNFSFPTYIDDFS